MAELSGGPVELLAADRGQLERVSTAERVADVLRTRIIVGDLPPGTRLSEEAIGSALGVSRNTLREAFRLLTHERLLAHELNRGVFVRTLTEQDVTDLYRLRKVVECGALRYAVLGEQELAAVRAVVQDAVRAAERADWVAVGTHNLRFHQALCALAGSPRVDEMMRGILAELRLVFHVMGDPRRFHEPYITRNGEIVEVLASGDQAGAERMLAVYLDEAEQQLTEGYRQHV
ncbi:GntR family transcriptional regulator [Kutzneria viridogrisea]|uniref:Transcription regulator, GntR family n=2 Tax=Kutzneria TaxID=43356 RepID=W5VYQ9_9PSEU|nr:GntR family transcriptional regulator [Kutzneria albida]AHH93580.1 transcription regulator, GntR family [Kutzneria albida DSM 43870]MBA8929035.1 DNA-binding GntR family transcriptional regulator [Kutzneria viridogrisea]